MVLTDRIAPDSEGNVEIPAHEFAAGLWLLRNGDVTQGQFENAFSLPSGELDELVTFYQGLSAADKEKIVEKIEACSIALQAGYINKAKFKNLLGLT